MIMLMSLMMMSFFTSLSIVNLENEKAYRSKAIRIFVTRVYIYALMKFRVDNIPDKATC